MHGPAFGLFAEGDRVFFASAKQVLCLNKEGGTWVSRTASTPSWGRCLALSPDGGSLAVGTHCKQLQVFTLTESSVRLVTST